MSSIKELWVEGLSYENQSNEVKQLVNAVLATEPTQEFFDTYDRNTQTVWENIEGGGVLTLSIVYMFELERKDLTIKTQTITYGQ